MAIVDREWAMQTYGGRNPIGQRTAGDPDEIMPQVHSLVRAEEPA